MYTALALSTCLALIMVVQQYQPDSFLRPRFNLQLLSLHAFGDNQDTITDVILIYTRVNVFRVFYLILFRTATHEKRFFTFLNYLGRRLKLSQVLSYANICQNNDIYKFLFVNFLLICTTLTSVPFISIFFER